MRIGQTVIIRTDLFKGQIGLTAAQVAHIHALSLYDAIDEMLSGNGLDPNYQDILRDWCKAPYVFVKQVPNLEALMHYKQKAEAADVKVHVWEDTVFVDLSPTQKEAFANVVVGISLGPDDDDAIKSVVGDLPLLS